MFPEMPLPVSSNCAAAPWLPEEAVGDFVTWVEVKNLLGQAVV